MTAFERYHPAVQCLYFAAVLVCCMAAFQPVCIVLALVTGFAYSVYLRGLRASLRTAAWQLPVIVLIALVNPLFSASGSTLLFMLGPLAVYSESLLYGICMGMMLVSVMLWFSNASHVLTTDKVMMLFGNVVPTIALMLSMATRLVPRYVERAGEIRSVQEACSAVRPDGARKGRIAGYIRLTSVLMGWSMEDSLETSDSMRARGWGAARKRSVYRRYRFRARDAVAAALLALFAVACAFLVWVACSQFHFYPKVSTLIFWWGYIPYAVLLAFPLLMQLEEAIRWR